MSGRARRHVHAHAVAEIACVLPAVAASRRLCLGCGLRRPLFRHRRVVKADADHTLCFQCYRALQQRARVLRMVTERPPLISRHLPLFERIGHA